MTPRTPYGMVAAFDVVTGDLPGLFGDLTERIAELTQGHPDRLDSIANAALPPSDTGELGFEDRDDGRLSITVGLGASLFDDRFDLRGHAPARTRPDALVPRRQPRRGAMSRRPARPGPVRPRDDHPPRPARRDASHQGAAGGPLGAIVLPVLRRRQPLHARRGKGVADARGLLGFADGSQNIASDRDELIFTGAEVPEWARGGSYLAVRLVRLKLERWDRLSRTAQDARSAATRCRARRWAASGRRRCRRSTRRRRATPTSGWPTRASRATRDRFLRRPFVYENGFDDYGLLDSGALFLAFCRDLERQFATIKRRTTGRTWTSTWSPSGAATSSARPGWRGTATTGASAGEPSAGAAGAPVGCERVDAGIGADGAAGELALAPPVGPHDEDPGLEGVVCEETPVRRPGHRLRRDRLPAADPPQVACRSRRSSTGCPSARTRSWCRAVTSRGQVRPSA